jgi:hypothetical protein
MKTLFRVLLLQEDADNTFWAGVAFSLYMLAISAGITLGAVALSR